MDFLGLLNTRSMDAYRYLYKRYYKPLVMFVLEMVDDLETAEDIVQEVIVAIWERQMVFDDLRKFEAFIFKSAHNRALNELKHRVVVQKTISKDVDEETCGDVADINFEEILENEDRQIRLFEAISLLPRRCQEVVVRVLDGKSNKEIAEDTSLSVETVKTHRKRAMALLRNALK